mmetsp:Transcript_15119/g.53075  ORF Transcript_15119/g.53075 Transcript_15119/m.53075 type:complete len:274 (+) Transcript_15119:849-1670(+)
MPRQIGPDICSSVVGLPGTSRDFRDVSGTEELKTWRTGILFQATLAENRWASPPIVDGAPTPRCGGSAGLLPPNGGAMPEIDRHVMPSPMGLTRPFTLWSWAKTDSLLLGENFTVDPGPEVSSATMLVFVSRRACCSVNACEASNKKPSRMLASSRIAPRAWRIIKNKPFTSLTTRMDCASTITLSLGSGECSGDCWFSPSCWAGSCKSSDNACTSSPSSFSPRVMRRRFGPGWPDCCNLRCPANETLLLTPPDPLVGMAEVCWEDACDLSPG